VDGAGLEWTTLCSGKREHLEAAVALAGGKVVDYSAPTLDEIFLARSQACASSIAED